MTASRNASRFDAVSADALGLVHRHTEWTFITKAIIQSQSKSLLLLGDAGSGKSALMHSVLSAMNQSPPHGVAHIPPQQGIALQLGQVPRAQWHHWRIERLLFDGLLHWAYACIGHILSQSNIAFEGVNIHLTQQDYVHGMQEAASSEQFSGAHAFWQSRIQGMIQEQQTLFEKWFTRHHAFIDEHAALLANPWGSIAAKIVASKALLGEDAPDSEQLVKILYGIGQTLRDHVTTPELSASFTLFIDEWDALTLQSPAQASANRKALSHILKGINDKKHLPLHVVVSTRPEQLMQQLGGGLYTFLRQKILLNPLSAEHMHPLIGESDKVPSSWNVWLAETSLGLPQHARTINDAANQKATALHVTPYSDELLDELGFHTVQDVWQGRFARLQLDALEHGTLFLNALQRLLAAMSHHPFYVDDLMASILKKDADHIDEQSLGLALRQLFIHDFLNQVETPDCLLDTSNDLQKPAYQFANRSAFQALYDFIMPNVLNQLHREVSDPADNSDLSTSLDRAISTEMLGLQNGQHAEHLVALLPATFAEGALTPNKVRSVVAFIHTLRMDQQGTLLTRLHAQFAQALKQNEHEQLRLHAAAALGEIPHVEGVPSLLQGLHDTAEPVRIASLESLNAWLHTAHRYRFPAESHKKAVFTEIIARLADPAFTLERSQSALFEVLRTWQGSTPAALVNPLADYLSQHIGDSASEVDASIISQGLLKCLHEVLQQSSSEQRSALDACLLKLIVASLPRPDLQTDALNLLPFAPIHTLQGQEVLQRIALQEGLPVEKRLIPLEVLFTNMSTLSAPVRQAIQSHLNDLFHVEYDNDIPRLKEQWIQTCLRLLKTMPTWPDAEQKRLFQTTDTLLAHSGLDAHLDVAWILLRLAKVLNPEIPSATQTLWTSKLQHMAKQGKQSAQLMQTLLMP